MKSISLKDDLGRSIELLRPASSVVSLVPSISELLDAFGIVPSGLTKFCVLPNDLKARSKVIGGTKNPRLLEIADLNPDLIVANKEENREEDIEWLATRFPVYVSDISSPGDNLSLINQLGILLNLPTKARQLREQLRSALDETARLNKTEPVPVAYAIWKDPWMFAGGDTYINSMLEHFGFRNVLGKYKRYPSLDLDELLQRQPRQILLSSEPYPFKESQLLELQDHFPSCKWRLVDGTHYSWYGIRLHKARTAIVKELRLLQE